MSFKNFRQLDSVDCGATCIKMIAHYYGKNIDISYLRENSYLSRNGSPLLGLNDAAERAGFRTMGINSSFENFIEKAIFPCIVHWRNNHYIVVYKVKIKKRNGAYKGKIYVSDPAYGNVSYSVNEFLEGWSDHNYENPKGTFLLLAPSLEIYKSDFKKNRNISPTQKLLLFANYLKPYKKEFIQILIGIVALMSFTFILPFMSQALVDRGIMNHNLNFIKLILISQLVLSISEVLINLIQGWLMLHTSGRISIALISDYIKKMLNLPISFFNTKGIGDIIQRIGDHSRIQSFLTTSTIGIIFALLNFIIFSFILAYYNLNILLVFIVGHTFYVIWILSFLKIRRDLDFKSFEKASINNSNTIEIIEGAEEIKLSGAEQKMRNKWELTQAELFHLKIRELKISQIQSVGSFFISNVTNILLSAMSAYLVINGEITLGMMMSLSFILGQLKGPISSFLGFIHSFQDAKISIERLSEIHFQKDENENKPENSISTSENENIYFNDVHFSYMGEKLPPILKGITLTIPKNKVTAIVGESGSGKTTLIKLLLGYFSPLKGTVKIGNKNLNDIDLKSWRDNCSAVMQDGIIFSATILENIAISEKNTIDIEKVKECCKKVNLHEFISMLPNKYNTKIGKEGNGISQGQRQRMLIARSLYKNPNYLFLDEATNALDANNEKTVIENLDIFLQNKTAVIIAHRLSTVKNADQIVVMSNGEIAEIGIHTELLSKKGTYYELVKNQLEL